MRYLLIDNLELRQVLDSILITSSILVSFGLGFILYAYNNFQNKRDELEIKMITLSQKLRYYKELIYNVFQTDMWSRKEIIKEYDSSIKSGDWEKLKDLKNEHEFLRLYESFKFISDAYSNDIMSEAEHKYSHSELTKYKDYINQIWYSINCRTDIKKDLNLCFITGYEQNRIKRISELINKLDLIRKEAIPSIDQVAQLSGEVEADIVTPLLELSYQKEKPIDSIVKKLFWSLSTILIVGVGLPLLAMFCTAIFSIYLVGAIALLIFICLLGLIVLTGSYIDIF